jgi:hypothetical protein
MWEPHCLTTLWASMACYRDSFIFFNLYPSICLWRLRKTSGNFNQNSCFPGQGMNLGYCRLKVGVLIICSWCSIYYRSPNEQYYTQIHTSWNVTSLYIHGNVFSFKIMKIHQTEWLHFIVCCGNSKGFLNISIISTWPCTTAKKSWLWIT